jgi:hypothetical protein
LVGKPGGRRPLGRPRRRWVDSIRVLVLEDVDWIHLAQDRDRCEAPVSTVMIGSGIRPASYAMVTGVLSSGKAAGA